MILKEIGRKIAQAFRSVKTADEKVASSIAATLDAKAEQLKEYEKSFEPEHPEPEPMQQVIQSLAAYGLSTDEAACAIAKTMRWLSGKCTCRNCYRANWQDENKALYEWDDLDGPRPTVEEYNIQEREEKDDGTY